MDFLIAFLGLVILVLAGDALVRGAVNVSLRLGIPALIVSLTIVSIGTSLPELLIAVDAVIEDVPGIAIGNVVGSNTANVLLVLGVPALLIGLTTHTSDSRQSYLHMLAATAFFITLAFFGPIRWIHGLLLLAVFAAFIVHAVIAARRHQILSKTPEIEMDIEGAAPNMRWRRILIYLALGIVGLPLGADLLVTSASRIARAYDVSETVIGLTLVAMGTSLPELTTSITAAYRRQADVAIGNAIGSNIANVLGIIGTAALFGTIPVSDQLLRFDLWVMAGASLLLFPFVFGRADMSRLWGAGFTALYVVYVLYILT